MNEIKRLLGSLSRGPMLSLIMAVGAIVGALALFSRWSRERDFRPLFSALSPEIWGSTGQSAGIRRRLPAGGKWLLGAGALGAYRGVTPATGGGGVPKSGRIGYELFDKNNFGMSDFTEQVNYHRALEGELERSVMSLSAVEQARVHITFPKDSLFLDNRQPAKASVLVKLRAGAQLSAQNVAAICQLAASAIDGLLPEAVSVVDMQGNLLNRARKASSPGDP